MGDAQAPTTSGLQRHFGLLHATALNVTMVVGTGVFITIPPMLKELPGPYALLGWFLTGLLILMDGMIWSELGAMFPGSGGSYLYLLECFGRERWGRFLAFLFIWQFLISGPLEIASGLISISQFAGHLDLSFDSFNKAHSHEWVWGQFEDKPLKIFISPARAASFLVGVLILTLLYRRISILGKLTLVFWSGVLAVIGWILVEGAWHFDAQTAFELPPQAFKDHSFVQGLGAGMRLAMYSYLGYYTVCYIGDEVRDPGRTIPRAILLSALLVFVLFLSLHLAMMGTVSWTVIPSETDDYSLAADFMRHLYGSGWAVALVTLLLIWSSFGSAFAGLLGYARVPFGAARYGHFFSVLGRTHPEHHIPHVSLLLMGCLTLFWSFFDLEDVINALIVTRILGQFVLQIVGVMLLRSSAPERPRPYRIWLYPVPCVLALLGWLFLYVTAGWPFIVLSLSTLTAGALLFLLWSRCAGGWPFGTRIVGPQVWRGVVNDG